MIKEIILSKRKGRPKKGSEGKNVRVPRRLGGEETQSDADDSFDSLLIPPGRQGRDARVGSGGTSRTRSSGSWWVDISET